MYGHHDANNHHCRNPRAVVDNARCGGATGWHGGDCVRSILSYDTSKPLAFGALFIALHSVARTIFVTFKRSWLQARHDYLERARRQAPNSQAHTAIMCLSLVRLYEMSSHGLIGFRRLFHSRAFERASVKYKVPNPFRSFHASGNPLLDKND